MDIEQTINHEKFDSVKINDLRSIPQQWPKYHLDLIQSSDEIEDKYKWIVNLFSDALDDLIAAYCRYHDGKTSDFSNRIEKVKGLFETQKPYFLGWLKEEAVRGNDHFKYLDYLAHNFILVFTHIGIDLNSTGIPSIIDEYLNLKTQTIEEEKRNEKKFNRQKPAYFTTLGRFCQLVSRSGLIEQGRKNQEDFTKEVCSNFGFIWSDKIRQAFGQSLPNIHNQKIKTQILPLLDTNSRNKILQYLNNEGKLYQ